MLVTCLFNYTVWPINKLPSCGSFQCLDPCISHIGSIKRVNVSVCLSVYVCMRTCVRDIVVKTKVITYLDVLPCACAAGQLMQSERDALLKLIQSLRHEYEAVQAAKMGQESEIQGLKVQPFCCLSIPVAAVPTPSTNLLQAACVHRQRLQTLLQSCKASWWTTSLVM